MDYIIKKMDVILYLGIADRSNDSLYYIKIINLSYFLTILSISFVGISFLLLSQWSIFCFNAISAFIAVMGVRFNLKEEYSIAAMFLPYFLTLHLILITVFFLGSNSELHWVICLYPIYAFTVFQREQFYKQILVVLLGVLGFLICEFLAPNESVLITAQHQVWLSVYAFLICMFFASLIVNLVITQLVKANKNLKHLSEIDELTGISNRRKVLADALDVFSNSVENREPCSFAILDLDHFKKINDTYGHDAGDLVLKDVALEMRCQLGSLFKLGRYGGEEFVVIMPNTSIEQAEKDMEQLRGSVSCLQIQTKLGIMVPVTISIGISSISFNTARYEEILSEADDALYAAKHEGRNQVKTYSIY